MLYLTLFMFVEYRQYNIIGTEYNIGKCYKQGRDHSIIPLRQKSLFPNACLI